MTTNLTPRTRLELRWSTDPKHVGYPEPHEVGKDLLQDRKPDFVGTPRQVEEEIAHVIHNIGVTTYIAIQIRTRTTQEEISRDDFNQWIFERSLMI